MNYEKNSIFPRKVEKWNGKWNEIRKNGTRLEKMERKNSNFPRKLEKMERKKF